MRQRRATLRVLSPCDNACVFCAPEGLDALEPRPVDGLRAALTALRADHDELTLTGGEPALHPDLAAVVSAARAAGFARVGVQTNGRRLREPGYAASLRDAGLTDVHLSLHGLAAAHDYHTGVEGSFTESASGLVAARNAGLTVVVASVLTRSNARSLGDLLPWLVARGVAAWCIAVPVTAGRLVGAFDRVFPRLAMALPPALRTLALTERHALPAWIDGAPLCLLGPYAARSLPGSAPRSYAPACEGCPARSWCPGLDAAYLSRFGGDEVSPARAPKGDPARVSEREAPLARMFVGPGALGPGGAVLESAARDEVRPRVSLPVAR